MSHASRRFPQVSATRSRLQDQNATVTSPVTRRLMAAAITGLLMSAAMFAWSTARAETPKVTLHVDNLVPRFMKFYHAAESGHLDPAQRWALWQKEDGIAAVPPTPLGKHLAHERLDKAWDKYRASVTRYPRNAARDEAFARTILPEVAHLLKAGPHPITVDLVLFVGEYSGNAYTVPGSGGQPASIYVPVEMPARWTRITLAHEFTHAVHAEIDDLKQAYAEPLGETVLKEGLAMHSSRHIVPGGPASAYTPAMSYGAAWQKTCIGNQRVILRGMLPYLDNATTKVTEKFTFGRGTTGLHDEVYCAGWIIAGKLLDNGYTYASLARIPESGMPGFVAQAIRRVLSGRAAEKEPQKRHHSH